MRPGDLVRVKNEYKEMVAFHAWKIHEPLLMLEELSFVGSKFLMADGRTAILDTYFLEVVSEPG